MLGLKPVTRWAASWVASCVAGWDGLCFRSSWRASMLEAPTGARWHATCTCDTRPARRLHPHAHPCPPAAFPTLLSPTSSRPHFFQHAGFRLVSGTGPLQTSCQDSPPPHVGAWDPSTKKGSQVRGVTV